MKKGRDAGGPVRYGVVGLGWIAQEAVLPAFRRAPGARLTALVSDDPVKLRVLGRKYRVDRLHTYAQYGECLASGAVDAVYIALPNDMHAEYTVRAAEAGIHVLCEKPMAVTEEECRRMIDATRRHEVRLMIAYRLHLEAANLDAIRIARSGRLGDVRLFNSLFTMRVTDPGNIRLKPEKGGGTLYDIGIYCINAARSIFGTEPIEASASEVPGKGRLRGVDEMTTAVLRFPGNRLASFTTSFGVDSLSLFQIAGTRGSLRVDPAYHHAGPLKRVLALGGRRIKKTFPARDQFAAELVYFSRCIRENREPEPSGAEGLADVAIIRALRASTRLGRPVALLPFARGRRPSPSQGIHRPPGLKPRLVRAAAPHGK